MARRSVRWTLPAFLMLTLLLLFSCSAASALDAETAPEDEATQDGVPSFAELKEGLDEFIELMSSGEVEEALAALERYLEGLKALTESEGVLTELELRVAHVLYATSKHLAVLARVYQKVPESARSGVGNALTRSIRGHSHFYSAMEGDRSGEEPAGEEAGMGRRREGERGGGDGRGRDRRGPHPGKGRNG